MFGLEKRKPKNPAPVVKAPVEGDVSEAEPWRKNRLVPMNLTASTVETPAAAVVNPALQRPRVVQNPTQRERIAPNAPVVEQYPRSKKEKIKSEIDERTN